MSAIRLNREKVPSEIADVLPFAERWGIGDDFEREIVLDKASTAELEEVAHCLDSLDDTILSSWLNGAESQRKPLSEEYLAVTSL